MYKFFLVLQSERVLILDILFWFSEICIFWPIQPYIIEPTNIWGTDNIIYNNEIIRKILLSLEFILFRVYGWFLITKFIENPKLMRSKSLYSILKTVSEMGSELKEVFQTLHKFFSFLKY